jgi:hypothetical protein
MIDPIEQIQVILTYWRVNRGVGHTRAIMRGVEREEEEVLLMTHGAGLLSSVLRANRNNVRVVTANHDLWRQLTGRHAPLVVDHFTISTLVKGVISQLLRDAATDDAYRARERAKRLETTLEDAERRVERLETLLNDIHAWLATEDGALNIPFQPPWYKRLLSEVNGQTEIEQSRTREQNGLPPSGSA